MDNYNNLVLTKEYAVNEQAAISSGNKITYTRFIASSDTFQQSDLQGFSTLTLNTINVKQSFPVSNVSIDGATATITGITTSKGNTADYYINTILLCGSYNGNEFLAAATTAITPQRIPAESTTESTEFTIRTQLTLSNTTTVSTTVNPVAPATNDYVDKQDANLQSQINSANTDRTNIWAKIATLIDNVTNQTIGGVKTFTNTIVGSITGNAGTATKWATARKLGVNLASTTQPTIDGSADVTNIGVSGILPVGNGGTGTTNGFSNAAVLGANADLNTITVVGNYRIDNVVVANAPISTAQYALLEVTNQFGDGTWRVQRITYYYTGAVVSMYVRVITTASPTNNKPWVKFFGSSDIVPIANGGTGNVNGAAKYQLIDTTTYPSGATIANSILNYLSDGTTIYAFTNATITGAPSGMQQPATGTMVVMVRGTSQPTSPYFRYFYLNDGTIWYQNMAPTVGAIRQIYTNSDVITIANGGTGRTDGLVKSTFSTLLSGGTDLNTITTAGNYVFNSDTPAVLNAPTGVSNGSLEVFDNRYVSNGYLVQRIVSNVSSKYIRILSNGTWGSWVQTFDTNSIIPVANGGTGANTLTGLVKGNGTGAMTAAVAGTDYVSPSGSISGNAGTATALQTARTIGTSGDVTGTGQSFNGTANITIPMTLASVTRSDTASASSTSTGGTFTAIDTVNTDAKGRLTGVNTKTVTLPQAANYLNVVALSSGDLNSVASGVYSVAASVTLTNAPYTAIGYILDNGTAGVQKAYPTDATQPALYRTGSGSTWTAWRGYI